MGQRIAFGEALAHPTNPPDHTFTLPFSSDFISRRSEPHHAKPQVSCLRYPILPLGSECSTSCRETPAMRSNVSFSAKGWSPVTTTVGRVACFRLHARCTSCVGYESRPFASGNARPSCGSKSSRREAATPCWHHTSSGPPRIPYCTGKKMARSH